MKKYIGQLYLDKNAGVLAVDLAGEPLAHYYDPGLALVSSGIKIGNHLYCGSVSYPYIIRLNLKQYPVRANTWAFENKIILLVPAASLMVTLNLQ